MIEHYEDVELLGKEVYCVRDGYSGYGVSIGKVISWRQFSGYEVLIGGEVCTIPRGKLFVNRMSAVDALIQIKEKEEKEEREREERWAKEAAEQLAKREEEKQNRWWRRLGRRL